MKLIEKTLENKNATGVNANIDNVHEDRNNNLTHYHNGRFWDVTEKFRFPKNVLLKHGWIACLKGFPEHRESTDERTFTKRIKPFYLMNVKLLPKLQCVNYLNYISHIMNLMEGVPEIRIDSGTVIYENFIDQ